MTTASLGSERRSSLTFTPAREGQRAKDVFIGPHCVILPNVRIGEGAVIRACTVVSRNVPPHVFWGPPSAEALGVANVPLTAEHSYEDFMEGLKLHVKRQPVGRDRES